MIERHKILFKVVTFILIFSIVLVPTMSFAVENYDEYLLGKEQGERDGKSDANFLWVLAGLGCGCIGVGAAYLIEPSAPAEKLVGKSPSYITGYSEGYRKARRNAQTLYAGVGWVIWIVIYFVAIYPSMY